KTTLALGGQSVDREFKIAADKDGRWTKITLDSPRGPVSLDREGGVARRTIKDKVDTITLKPDAGLFESFIPALMTREVRRYDQAKGGKQTFPVFIVPALMADATLERKESVDRAVGGRDVKFSRYAYGVMGVDLTLWLDPAGKLVFAEIPAQHAAFVREG